ncbi:Maf family protein [Telmatospirillum siberiense]|uniref:Nucleoside triphosphate pyrophosphatase n=1 Tax=Telmatospirillum siberiense TaxID=382514 RepID=A0A2N3PMY5_9PROT|nr:Maf family protein [Telmatospirillum siberiense]PKU21766.1 septum formation protein Maf [Telmatospirillum siberiense]
MTAAMPALLLASASPTRLALLTAAGVAVKAIPADVEEDAIKMRLRAAGAEVGSVARALAQAKAVAVAKAWPDALVIGADQMLICGENWYDKPGDVGAARRQLRSLRGKTHRLLSAATVVRGETVLWQHLSEATLTMRSFGQDFLDDYLQDAGPAILSSVGAYQLEGLGAQLFERIEGDHFTILGLPLIALLDFLRSAGVLKT